MMLTTKGRYAVMAMAEMALSKEESPRSLAEIAMRQGIALAYLEQIFSKLRKCQLVKSVRGPGGGYLLARNPFEITVADIITAVEEPIKMTRCNHDPAHGCGAVGKRCLTHDLWDGLGNHIYAYLHSVTLEDVCNKKVKKNPEYINIEPIKHEAHIFNNSIVN